MLGKEAMTIASTGYIQVNTYLSNARIPLKDTAITIIDDQGNPIAHRLTNRNGQLDTPVAVAVPNMEDSQQPGFEKPYTTVELYAKRKNLEEIHVKGLQVFADIVTTQNLEMIPLSELPNKWITSELFQTTPQNL